MISSRSDVLKAALQQRILIIDGAMGTMIQRHKLQEEDYRGTRFADWPHDVKGNNDLLVLTKPDIIAGIHDAYCAAGADILETNSFNSTVVSQADYHMEELVYELNVEAARVARAVADKWTAQTPEKPRFVAGVLGPTSRTCSISPDVNPSYRNVTFDELVTNYLQAAEGLVEGGADILLIETVFDTLNCKAAIFAVVNETSFSENCFWLNGQCYPLNHAQFKFDIKDTLQPWQITADNGQLQLQFQPMGMHREKVRAGFLNTHFRQMFGEFQGCIVLNGEEICLDGLKGFVEDQYIKW